MLAHSKNVVLRKLEPKDLDAFHAYRSDPVVARYQGWSAMHREGAQNFLAEMSTAALLAPGCWTQLGLAHSETDVLFGDVGIHIAADQSKAELGISLSQNAQGLGLGCAAVTLVADWIFAQTPVMRILAITDAHNLPALRLLKRTAFQHTHDTSEIVDGTPLNERWFELRRNLHR